MYNSCVKFVDECGIISYQNMMLTFTRKDFSSLEHLMSYLEFTATPTLVYSNITESDNIEVKLLLCPPDVFEASKGTHKIRLFKHDKH